MPRGVKKESSDNVEETIVLTFEDVATTVGHFPTLKKAWQALVGARHPEEHDVPMVVRLGKKQYIAYFISEEHK